MISPSYCQRMAEYNQWMNQRLYEVCGALKDEERKRDRGAFFGSVHGTLNHLLYGDRAWLGRFTGSPASLPPLGQDLYADFEELRRQRDLTDQALLLWANQLSESWLAQPLEYTSGVDAKTRRLPVWLLVTHLFNHQTHHRGQVTTLLSQMGHDLGVTDLPWLPTLNPEA